MAEKKDTVFIKESLEKVAEGRIVLDVGGGERFGKWMRPYEALFKNCDYRSFDYDSSTNADVVGDIHAIPLPDASVDSIICSSVLEHVINPIVAMRELSRILRPGGPIFFYVPSTYPYHARKGHYADYWRFFDDTIEILFEGFSEVNVHKRGGYFMALSFFCPGQHRLRGILDLVASSLDTALKTHERSTTAGYYVFARKAK